MTTDDRLGMDPIIVCIDCGGNAHLITVPPVDDFYPGDVLIYRCADCNDRWDIVWDPDGELD